MFGVSLPGKIRHISLFSAPMAKVKVYRVKYVHHESALLAEGFTVSQLIFHPECPDTAARDNLLASANPLVSEAQDFLSRVIEAATAYGSAEPLSLARDHYLSTSKPLSLTEKIAQLHLQTKKIIDPIPEITGAFISNEFFSEEGEALVMSFSADEDHQWLSEGHRTMLHFGFRYNPETKEVEPFEPTPPEVIQRIGLRAFLACAQVLPSSLLCPNMWSLARYEPGSGLMSHVDVPQLGPYVLDGSFGSGAEMEMERTSIQHPQSPLTQGNMRRINEPTLGVTLLCTGDVVFALRPRIPSNTIIACSQAWQGHRSTTPPVRNMNSLTPVTARYAMTGLICAHCVPDHKVLWFCLWEALMSLPNTTRPQILSAPLPPISATAREVR